MRGAIAWSFDLLEENEKILFRRLAVFAGGFTIEAVESICSTDEIDALNCLTSLIENSLIVQTETAEGESRFRLLEVVREYAHEVLNSNGERNLIKQKHAAFYLAFAKEAEPKLYGEQTTKWLNRLEEEHNNIRAALSWSVINDVKTAISLAGAIRRFWILHNHLKEGRKWQELALEQGNDVPADAHFKLLHGIGQAALYQGDGETARKIFEENLARGKAANDLRQIALSNRGLGGAAKQKGDLAAARKYIEDGLKISREADDKFGIAVSLNNLGDLARMENDFKAARSLLEEALSLSRELGNKEGICGSLNNLGAAAYGEGDYKPAHAHFTEAIAIGQKLGDKVSVSYSLDGFAALAVKKRNFNCAAQLAGAAEHLRESLGFDTEPAERLFREAYIIELHSATDGKSLTEARGQGHNLKIEKAVKLALTIGKQN
jgi:tetratricopeptide (TPR) repeat protein